MNKHRSVLIAVCGSPGSGKSTLAWALGRALATSASSAVCVSPDKVSPSIPFWLPSVTPSPGVNQSLGALLQYNLIDPQAVADCLIPVDKCPNLAVMGMEYGCYKDKYSTSNQKAVNTVLEILKRETDFVVTDCVTDIGSDTFSLTAFENADIVLCTLTPNCKGLSWLQMAENQGRDLNKAYKFLCPVLRESPIKAMEERIGKTTACLPFSDEIELKMCSGTPLSGFEREAGRYFKAVVDSLASHITQAAASEDENG